ncbi:putative nuclear RNA export factor SDE5 isoform X2 [Cicer arietinum]|uniref:Nuclear RNA export factor SDE5 n=1 Tax=Cicer arietinum TaxID=3827 RepID=A0A1S2X9R0_CICAR|nr:putative nuclear RNA export factor SDE5 [Cicer arietinum]XP_004485770.1 putative nuclear RNA export factor SDE5 [Cicer arietinum]
MEVAGQNIVIYDEDKALKFLLEAFGHSYSLEEIASAYCKASRNLDLAAEILYEMKGSSSTSGTLSSSSDTKVEESSESSDGHPFENSFHGKKSFRPKVRPVSTGSVSSIIGKSYVRPVPSVNRSNGTTKPAKLDAKTLPMTGIWRENSKSEPKSSKHDHLQDDMEEFLFKMLGDGFQLDRNMIREVLGTCGYDMQKSLEKLLDQSAMDLDKRPAVGHDSPGKLADMKPKSEASPSERKSWDSRGNGNIYSIKEVELHQRQKERHDIQKEVLSNLFSYPEHFEEPPKRIVRGLNKNSPYGVGHVVFEPPKDSPEEYKIDMDFGRRANEADGEDEADYQCVRKAVKEYRVTMMEYYKAAVDAFAKGDQIKAQKFLDEGQFYLKKAREADEESSRMILETRTTEAQEMVLDLSDHEPKDAIRLLKCHLSSLSGITSFDCLKVIFNPNDQAKKKRSCRRVVLKLLEEESIKWIEGEMAGTILIRLDNIERKRLSFFKT